MRVKKDHKEYQNYVESITPKHNHTTNCLNAFWLGGLICVIGEIARTILTDYFELNDKDAGSATSIVLISISVLLTGFNLYKPLAKLGGAGALVPITGFANSVASPIIEYKKEGEVFGKGVKAFTIAGPVILFGMVTSFIAGMIYFISINI